MAAPRSRPRPRSVSEPVRRVSNPRGEGHRLREDILEAACRLLEDSGSEDAVTLRATARRAGVTAPALYLHFENREALLRAAIEGIFESLATQIEAAMDAETTAPGRLRAATAAYVAFGHAQPAAYRVLFSRNRPSAVPVAASRAAELFGRFTQVVAACGSPAAEADPVEAATMLWATVHGLAELPISQPRYPWPDESRLLDIALAPYLPPS